MPRLRILPPTYLLLALLLMLALHLFLPLGRIIPAPWNLAGLVPLAVGVRINLLADRAFRKAGTTVKPFEEPSTLLTDGVFRFSRHPMYLGFLLALIGVAALLRSLTPWIVVPVFGAWMEVAFVRHEESALAVAFGEQWESYKTRVRRWL
jgi:protein-S-isoprenylcysteine O-methyltransferase Ste14